MGFLVFLLYSWQLLLLGFVYLIAAFGATFSIRTGNINLGGEGQIYLGGFLCAILLNKLSFLSPFLALPLVLLISGFASSLLTLLSTFLQNKKNISFMLSTFMISCAIIPFIGSLITNTFKTKQGSLIATDSIPENFKINFIPFLVIIILISVLILLFFYKSEFGKQSEIFGIAPEFSNFTGLNKNKITYVSSMLSGFLHGIAGAFVITSILYTCHLSFYFGIGWNALTVTLLAKSKPSRLPLSALFLTLLLIFSGYISMICNFYFDFSSLIQGIIILLTAIPIIKTGCKKRRGTK